MKKTQSFFKKILLPVAACALNLAFLTAAHAAPGDLDASFGANGLVQTTAGGMGFYPSAAQLQSDGKYIVVGTYNTGSGNGSSLVRFNADGTVDNTFGDNGEVLLPLNVISFARSIIITQQGDYLVAGEYRVPFEPPIASNKSRASLTVNFPTTNAVMLRVLSDGSIDGTFADGGALSFSFGGHESRFVKVKLTPGGDIIAFGGGFDYDTFTSKVGVAKFSSNGINDETFGNNGVSTFSFNNNDSASTGELTSDGKIVMGVIASDCCTTAFGVARLNADGSMDTDFSGDGKYSFTFSGQNSYLRDIFITPDNKIIAVGRENSYVDIARLNTDGTMDTSFSDDGMNSAFVAGNSSFDSFAMQPSGSIVAAGSVFNGGSDFALARLMPNGNVDTNFGMNGVATTSFGFNSNDSGQIVIAQPDAKLVMFGTSENKLGAARYSGVASPTAAQVTVGGRVLSAKGRGIANVRVTLTGANGETKSTVTGPMGYYRFNEVTAGADYILSVFSKRYSFTEPTQVQRVLDETTDINFFAEN